MSVDTWITESKCPIVRKHVGTHRDLLTDPVSVSDLGARIVAGFLADLLERQWDALTAYGYADQRHLDGLNEAQFELSQMSQE